MKHPFVMAMAATFAIIVGLAGLTYSRSVDDHLSGSSGRPAVAKQPPASEAQPDSSGAQVAWQSYDSGMANVKAEDKFAMVEFFATWCGYCRKMDQEVFTNAAVLDEINQYFVPVRVTESSQDPVTFEGQTMTEKELTAKYAVTGFPTIVFLKPNGEAITRIPGYVGPDEMKGILRFIGTKAYESMDYTAYKEKHAS